MIKTDPSLTFITLSSKNQTLIVMPTKACLGNFQLYLISSTTQAPSIMLVQQVIVKVYPSNGSFIDVEATISSVSNSGLVAVDFNQKMNTAQPNEINQKALNVYITDISGAQMTSVNFTWAPVSYSPTQPPGASSVTGYKGSRLTLQLTFKDPLSISVGVSFIMTNHKAFPICECSVPQQDSVYQQSFWHSDLVQVLVKETYTKANGLFM